MKYKDFVVVSYCVVFELVWGFLNVLYLMFLICIYVYRCVCICTYLPKHICIYI